LFLEIIAWCVFIFSTPVVLFYAITNFIIATRFTRWGPKPDKLTSEPVTIIVPVRNDFSIFHSIDSIRRINYIDYKILIVDDSSDSLFSLRLDTLNDEKTEVIHRPEHIGGKAGALNYVLQRITSKYTVIFDADHRPIPEFLTKAVSTIEENNADCVCGYQRHIIGGQKIFDNFYRACHAAAIVNFKSRNKLGLGTIFGGGCAIFNTKWLQKHLFDITSITEDWELSLRSYLEDDFKIVIRDDLVAYAAIPKNAKAFIRQQLRWAEGTIADYRKHFKVMLKAKISRLTKLGLFYQGFYFAVGLAVTLSWTLFLLPNLGLPLLLTIPLLVFFIISWGSTFYRGMALEKYGKRKMATCFVFGFLLSIAMSPIYAYATIRGLVNRRTFLWKVTERQDTIDGA
jgi:cellulose synthase/poly-beta-1,6-N-acetylglucosamine synthase-like glycosyltransferase